MRENRRCPKCNHAEILLLKRVAGELVYMSRPPGQAASPPLVPGAPAPASTWRRASPREAYICRACGFTEYYTLDVESIPVDGDLVALLSSEPGGPYR
jgi:predicted nucleic-acid-binding Zn-ribbon protein